MPIVVPVVPRMAQSTAAIGGPVPKPLTGKPGEIIAGHKRGGLSGHTFKTPEVSNYSCLFALPYQRRLSNFFFSAAGFLMGFTIYDAIYAKINY